MQNRTDSGTPRFSTPESNMGHFLLTTSQFKSPNGQNMRETCIISSDFLFVHNILSFPSILCVVKRNLGYKFS